MTPGPLPYRIMDADEHSYSSGSGLLTIPGIFEQYIDPGHRDKAIRTVTGPDGESQILYAGKPARLAPRGSRFQITFAGDQLEDLGVTDRGTDDKDAPVVPGSLLNRLNPLRGLDEAGRKEFVERYRRLTPSLSTPELRIAIMDEQGIECAVNYLNFGPETNFEHDIEALYANTHAANRFIAEQWGYAHAGRLFTPPFLPLVDVDLALAELDYVMERGATLIQISTGPTLHRSPFRPELDPFWARVNEAGINVCTHLASATYYGRQGAEWDEDEVILADMNAFQWTMYYGDRPAFETVAAAILQGWLARFPNIKLLLSEQGTVWVPYIVRKMDHAFLMGRRATWGKLEMRPSEYFRQRILVAPYPEENVERVVEVVGIEPIVFGSDFPHAEGLPDPTVYLGQLKSFSDAEIKAIMRDNLARYFGVPA